MMDFSVLRKQQKARVPRVHCVPQAEQSTTARTYEHQGTGHNENGNVSSVSHEGEPDPGGTHGTQRQNERVPAHVPLNPSTDSDLLSGGHNGHDGHAENDVNDFAEPHEPKGALKGELLAALRESQRDACGQSRAETPDKSGTQTVSASSALPLSQPVSRTSLETINEDCTEYYNERAGIMEYDGGLSREDAEAAARDATEKHRRECFERLEKAANAILSAPTRAMQKRELAKYCAGKSATACTEMRGWLADRRRGDDLE